MQFEPIQLVAHHQNMKYTVSLMYLRSGSYWFISRINLSSMSKTTMLLSEDEKWLNYIAANPKKFATSEAATTWLENFCS